MAVIERNRTQAATASGLDALLGIWLLVSPWVLSFQSTVATGNAVVLGILIGLMAAIRWSNPTPQTTALSWINCVLGLWVLISPWVLGYSVFVNEMWNSVIVGLAVIILAAVSAMATTRADAEARDRYEPPY